MSRLSVIIPCCDEEESVPRLSARLFPVLDQLRDQYEVELILVDDGSRDDTWQQLRALHSRPGAPHIVLARHEQRRGLGAALRTGHQRATGQIIVTLDADGTYPFAIVEPLVAAIEAGADVATASPYHRDGRVEGVSPLRLFFSKGASLCYRLVVDPRISTYTAMVRAYRAPVLGRAISSDDGFLHVAMTLVEARRRGATIVEIPATLRRREAGASKARILRITRAHLGYLRHLLRLRLTRDFWLPAQAAPRAEAMEPVRHG